jgi:hypothetical protein
VLIAILVSRFEPVTTCIFGVEPVAELTIQSKKQKKYRLTTIIRTQYEQYEVVHVIICEGAGAG